MQVLQGLPLPEREKFYSDDWKVLPSMHLRIILHQISPGQILPDAQPHLTQIRLRLYRKPADIRHGLRQLSYMKELGMGNDRYTLIDIDHDDAVITAEDAVADVCPFIL